MVFELVDEEKEFKTIEMMAGIIWPTYYKNILPREEIAYILKEYLSADAIKNATRQGHTFVIMYEDDIRIGFMSYKFERNYIFISNLYILPQYRDKNVGKASIDYLDQFNLPLEIHVNENNTLSIDTLTHLGFHVNETIKENIGNGYINNDVVLKKGMN